MKKIIFTLLFLSSLIYAKENPLATLYEEILTSIFHSQHIRVFADKEVKNLLKNSTSLEVVDRCDKSVTLLIGSFSNIVDACKDKPIFSTSYRKFKKNPNAFGVYYWRKGRPQLKFKRIALQRHSLSLPDNLQRYIYE